MTTTARATLQSDDDRVRVTRWDFEPGESTGRHVHGYDYVVIPVTDGLIEAVSADGESTRTVLHAGISYARSGGVEHDVTNVGNAPLAFVEVELK